MNNKRFYLKMVAGSLFRRKSRMVTALLAVAAGAAILSGLVTLSIDIPRHMRQEFRSYGANLALIPAGASGVISTADYQKARTLLPAKNLTGAAPYRYLMVKINEQPFMAAGTVLTEAKKTSPYWLVQGRWPEKPGEALIGREVAEMIRLLPGADFTVQAGSGLQIGGEGMQIAGGSMEFSVSGIVQTGGSEEAFVFMSLEDFEAMSGSGGVLDAVECSVSLGRDELNVIAQAISAAVPEINARLVKRVTDSEGAVLSKLKTLIALVTVIVLLLIMICVATTMMAVVAERRREIGLRKALGADSSSLAAEFLGEGMFLGAAGGFLGALAGFGFAYFVGLRVFNSPVAFLPPLLPLTMLASVIVTALACVIPVRNAASVDPAIVLRGE
ncbi:MAG: FtsX-like permease family protein [Spirochaetaceae bacterium]|jgi:putative ABC transport system permease protein|nr:FtsX-like permease family protein [Spirochaetaceae bacterium]